MWFVVYLTQRTLSITFCLVDETTADLFEALALLRQERDDADFAYRNLQNTLVAHLEAKHQKTATVRGKKFTVVVTERTIIDEDGLKKGLGARTWNQFTIKKLDRKKLEQALQDGSVDPVLVAKHSSVKRDTPYIRISSVEQD